MSATAMPGSAPPRGTELARRLRRTGADVPIAWWRLRVDILAAAGPGPRLREALERIEPWRDEFAVAGSTHYLGSVEYFIGRGREVLRAACPLTTPSDRCGFPPARATTLSAQLRRAPTVRAVIRELVTVCSFGDADGTSATAA